MRTLLYGVCSSCFSWGIFRADNTAVLELSEGLHHIPKGSNFVPIYDQVTNVPWNCFEPEWEAEPPLPPGMRSDPREF
ncbi:hypothetical protein QOT17_004488 [Balamuthia mandrillaris]